MWLASVSRRNRTGRLLATGEWQGLFGRTYKLMRMHLHGVGDPARERLFRMNVTLCLHRVVSDDELAGLPPGWEATAGGLAGGPVEVLWSKGLACAPSCLPCERPERRVVTPGRPDLWLPMDCQTCPPCVARAAILVRGGATCSADTSP